MKNSKKSNSNNFSKVILTGFLLLGAVAYVAKFGGSSILRLYVKTGIGDCHNLSIFCTLPDSGVVVPEIDKEYLAGLTRYSFPLMEIYLPKNIKAVQGEISKVYFKKQPKKIKGGIAYLVAEPANFFVDHYPKIRAAGIKDDYEFIRRVMRAKVDTIVDVNDAFFVVMKSLFTTNLGDQKNVKIIEFAGEGARGFISYNLTPTENYFDCNMLDARNNYFKVYIKDKSGSIDLKKFFTIIATVKRAGVS